MSLKRLLIIAALTLPYNSSLADWSANLGANNPFTSNLGVNFMYMWPSWAVEAGLGYISGVDRGDDTSGINLGGGVNGKYLYRQGLFIPYIQVGIGLSSGVTGEGAGRGSDGLLFGFGMFVWATEFHIYASYNLVNGEGLAQFGIGFPLASITGSKN